MAGQETPDETKSHFHGTLSPLGVPDYRRLLFSNALWWQAMWMEMIVIGWLVLELTNSAWQVALIGFYRMAPLLIVGFFAGPVADRFGRRKVIITAQTFNLCVIIIITLLLWADRLTFWQLAVTSAFMGTTWALDWTARRSLLPDLVGKSRTMDAMLLEGFTQNLSRVIGPFSSGALIAALGARGCYTALAAVSAFSLFFLFRLSKRPIPPLDPNRPSPWTLMVEGLRYVKHSPAILGVLLITIALNFLAFPYMTLLPVFARDILNQGPVGLGLLATGNGVGAFIGLFLVNYLRRFLRPTWIYAGGSLAMAIALIGFALSPYFYLSFALLLLAGIGQSGFGILQSSIVLLSARDDMRSRAMGTIVLGIGTGPPGRLLVGGLAEHFGSPFAVSLMSALAALCVLVTLVALPGFWAVSGDREDAAPDAEP